MRDIAGCYQQAVADQPLSKSGLVGREDNAKQIRQLLTMGLWYRNARSMGVVARRTRTP